MQHFPVFLALEGRRVLIAGGGEVALAKLRLLLKTPARIEVLAPEVLPAIAALGAAGRIVHLPRRPRAGDARGVALVYAASGEAAEDARVAALAQTEGALVNIVDNLEDSGFLTPAIVDRDPVCIAIGTEGAAPVLARALKADLEARLPAALGPLARIGKTFRAAAEALPQGRRRRAFWADYYRTAGPRALDRGGEAAALLALDGLLAEHLAEAPGPGRVDLVGAGPGDPELLTLKARRALDAADVIVHDRLVAPAILELARREARIVEVGKEGFGPSVAQEEINALMIAEARAGAHVVRLKSGDGGIFGRLDEEIAALDAAGIDWAVVPGITSAAAAAASLGRSLTARGRNGSLRLLTGHDVQGFAEQDWVGLARPGEVAAIYMGKRAARFLQGRLLMHGAAPETPVTVVENASRPDERVIATRLSCLPEAVAGLTGPAVLLYGLAPRAAAAADLAEAVA